VAINPSTPLEKIFPLISYLDFVQFMGNDQIGVSGVALDEKIYERIRLFKKKNSDVPLEIDIGVDINTAPVLIEAGATKLVVGSAIWSAPDIIGAIEYFKNL